MDSPRNRLRLQSLGGAAADAAPALDVCAAPCLDHPHDSACHRQPSSAAAPRSGTPRCNRPAHANSGCRSRTRCRTSGTPARSPQPPRCRCSVRSCAPLSLPCRPRGEESFRQRNENRADCLGADAVDHATDWAASLLGDRLSRSAPQSLPLAPRRKFLGLQEFLTCMERRQRRHPLPKVHAALIAKAAPSLVLREAAARITPD